MQNKDPLEQAYSYPKSVPWYEPEAPQELVALVSKLSPCNVLDVGCGTGDYAIYLAKKGFEVTAIDISKKAIQYAKEKSKEDNVKIDFRVLDAVNISQLKKKFDLVLEWGLLHFISFGQRVNYIKSVANLLNDGGKYVSLSFSEESPEWGGGRIRKGLTGSTVYYSSMEELETLLKPFFKIIGKKKRHTEFRNSRNKHIHNYLLLEKR